jgi:hypothetical protein
MAKIANHKIEAHISTLAPFVNYNGSIIATNANDRYRVSHWRTPILTYDINTGRIEYLYSRYYSQTTSALVGRIVRNLPRQAVIRFLEEAELSLDPQDKRRIVKMAKL